MDLFVHNTKWQRKIEWFFGLGTNTTNEILSQFIRFVRKCFTKSRNNSSNKKTLLSRSRSVDLICDCLYTLFPIAETVMMTERIKGSRGTTMTECQLINFYWWYFQWSDVVWFSPWWIEQSRLLIVSLFTLNSSRWVCSGLFFRFLYSQLDVWTKTYILTNNISNWIYIFWLQF